jgi:hypothetical protein
MFKLLEQLNEGKAVLINKALNELGASENEDKIEQWSLVLPNGEWYNEAPKDRDIFTVSPSKYMMLSRIMFDKVTNDPVSCENFVIRTKNKWIKQVLMHEINTTKNTWKKFFNQLKEQNALREEHEAYSVGVRSEALMKLREMMNKGEISFTQ